MDLLNPFEADQKKLWVMCDLCDAQFACSTCYLSAREGILQEQKCQANAKALMLHQKKIHNIITDKSLFEDEENCHSFVLVKPVQQTNKDILENFSELDRQENFGAILCANRKQHKEDDYSKIFNSADVEKKIVWMSCPLCDARFGCSTCYLSAINGQVKEGWCKTHWQALMSHLEIDHRETFQDTDVLKDNKIFTSFVDLSKKIFKSGAAGKKNVWMSCHRETFQDTDFLKDDKILRSFVDLSKKKNRTDKLEDLSGSPGQM